MLSRESATLLKPAITNISSLFPVTLNAMSPLSFNGHDTELIRR